MDDDSELSNASAESGVFPVELFGDEPSLSRVKSDFPSQFELTIDHGRGFGATTGQVLNLKDFPDSSEKTNRLIY